MSTALWLGAHIAKEMTIISAQRRYIFTSPNNSSFPKKQYMKRCSRYSSREYFPNHDKILRRADIGRKRSDLYSIRLITDMHIIFSNIPFIAL